MKQLQTNRFILAGLLFASLMGLSASHADTATPSSLLQDLSALEAGSTANDAIKKHFPLGESVQQAQTELDALGFTTSYKQPASLGSSPYLLAVRPKGSQTGLGAQVTVVLYYQSGAVIDSKGFITR